MWRARRRKHPLPARIGIRLHPLRAQHGRPQLNVRFSKADFMLARRFRVVLLIDARGRGGATNVLEDGEQAECNLTGQTQPASHCRV